MTETTLIGVGFNERLQMLISVEKDLKGTTVDSNARPRTSLFVIGVPVITTKNESAPKINYSD